MKRFFATLLWVPMVLIAVAVAMIAGLFVALAALLIPAVRWLARVGDEG